MTVRDDLQPPTPEPVTPEPVCKHCGSSVNRNSTVGWVHTGIGSAIADLRHPAEIASPAPTGEPEQVQFETEIEALRASISTEAKKEGE